MCHDRANSWRISVLQRKKITFFSMNHKAKISISRVISERRRETLREASRRSTQRASCYSHMGKQNNIITRELLSLAMWLIRQKFIPFWCRTVIRDTPARPKPAWLDPARPGQAMTLFDGLFLKCVKIYENETFTYDWY